MISENDLAALVRALETEQLSFTSGDHDFGTRLSFKQADDMSIFGPFGGPPGRMTASRELSAMQSQAAKQFQGGSGTIEVVKTIASEDLAILVLIEHNNVRVLGRDEPQPWVLRTTQVFRLDPEQGWVRLHRHADPLIRFRPGDDTFAIAAG